MIDLLLANPTLVELAEPETKAVKALRLWAALQRGGQSGMKAIEDSLGSPRAAAHLHLLLEEVAVAWTEPFAVSPLCCPRLSHDEALLADMLHLGRTGDRPGFDRLLCEMVAADERERLFLSATVLARFL
jgi:hypothetical protein